ncbi:beta-lactamase-like protein [Ephemerocybe angulata]|uniref:Beta-lactamase-like protein n=1 Tax=Ephemerocybe angulata TaxID=980116 RepID=A0A8H6MHH6_9AGAR|nr:beta-lactamase-like protein [Tulosesus angulatus]
MTFTAPQTSPETTSDDIDFIFLGTGTSSSLPHIECLTEPAESSKPPCRSCLSTLHPEGKKNIRRNTGAVLRVKGKDGNPVTIVIDAGKTFQASALEWFPKNQLRRIDALLITHPHADAMNGLDDLRAWTLNNAIQPHIDLYVSEHTYVEVQRAFPYLVAKEFASGGGDVPEFKWHIINDQESFEIGDTGIKILPFAVHHGRFFSRVPPPVYAVTPNATLPSTPRNGNADLPATRSNSPTKATSILNGATEKEEEKIYPYLCLGFKIENRFAYISDVSHIPDHIWPLLEPRIREDGREEHLPLLIMDCLRLRPHTSHNGLEAAMKMTRRIDASKTYLTGFSHEVSHDEYVKLGEIIGGAEHPVETLTAIEKAGLELIGSERGHWVRPAYDGLRVSIKRTRMGKWQ